MPEDKPQPLPPIERYGLGQSGYTSGRVERDPSLGPVGVFIGYPPGTDEERALEFGDDERFSGAGGIPLPAPEPPEPRRQ